MYEAIRAELEVIAVIPSLRDKITQLRLEMVSVAINEFHASDGVIEHSDLCKNLWSFWLVNKFTLPFWSSASNTIAILMTSSGSVERIFHFISLFLMTEGTEDLRELSNILRYKINQIKSERDQ